jgi:hypothetical protein
MPSPYRKAGDMTATALQWNDFRCGSNAEILAASTCFPVYLWKRTSGTRAVISALCPTRTWARRRLFGRSRRARRASGRRWRLHRGGDSPSPGDGAGDLAAGLDRGDALLQRLSHKPDSKYGLLVLVQKLYAPFGVLFHLAGDAANQIAADLGHFVPRCGAVEQLNAIVLHTGVIAIADFEIDVPFGHYCTRPRSRFQSRPGSTLCQSEKSHTGM